MFLHPKGHFKCTFLPLKDHFSYTAYYPASSTGAWWIKNNNNNQQIHCHFILHLCILSKGAFDPVRYAKHPLLTLRKNIDRFKCPSLFHSETVASVNLYLLKSSLPRVLASSVPLKAEVCWSGAERSGSLIMSPLSCNHIKSRNI